MGLEKAKFAPVPTIKRLPSYLQILYRFRNEGKLVVSCTHIANELKSDPTGVRKDLEYTGVVGKPKIGYEIPLLIEAIENFLGWKNTTDAFLVGAGSLGTALLGYERFKSHGLNIVAAFDIDPRKVGHEIHGKAILSISKMHELVARMHISIGILAVPADCAQDMADAMIEGGIKAIWNFAPTTLQVPKHVIVENAQLANSLAVLTSKLNESSKTDIPMV